MLGPRAVVLPSAAGPRPPAVTAGPPGGEGGWLPSGQGPGSDRAAEEGEQAGLVVAPSGAATSGPKAFGPRIASPKAVAASQARATSSAGSVTSKPAARARSQRWISRSNETNRSIPSAKVMCPNTAPSKLAAAASGSCRWSLTTRLAAAKAAASRS